MSIIILLKLLLAHILSDFVLQTEGMCNGKKTAGLSRFRNLFLHGLIHAATAYLLVSQWSNWMIPSVLFLTHFIMDYIKSTLMKENLTTFIVDQAVHIGILFILWLFLFQQRDVYCIWLIDNWNDPGVWAVIVAYLLVLKPTSVFLNIFIKRWTPQDSNDHLPNAGKWIGYLERILILTFIFTSNTEGIGFLLAAKSIFRFGELSKAKEIKTTEYVLIGTLASFTVAISIGFVLLKMM